MVAPAHETDPSAPSTATPTPHGPPKTRILAKILSHPLVVLAIGALLSGIIVPIVTRGWQDHAQQLQIKTDLVTTISESTTRALVGLTPPGSGGTSAAVTAAHAQWAVDSAVIWSKLASYFPGASLVDEWNGFSQAMDGLYALSRAQNPTDREATQQSVCRYLAAHAVPCPSTSGDVPWDVLAQDMRQVQVGIVNQVLAHNMSL